MKILYICREMPPVGGGAGNVAFNLACQLAQTDGFEIHYLTMGHSLIDTKKSCSVRVHQVPCFRKNIDSSRPIELMFFLLFSFFYAAYLQIKFRFDVIHSHSVVPEGVVGGFVKFVFRSPLHVITAHGSDVPGYNEYSYSAIHKYTKIIWQFSLNSADKITCPSSELKQLMISAGCNREVCIVPNGIPDFFVDFSQKKRGILMSSRLVKRKRFDVALKALQEVNTDIPIHIVGDGPELNNLKSLVGGSSNQIYFHGWLENRSEEWKAVYQSCSIFIFPSEKESFGIAPLEAACFGMTVVSSNLKPVREVLGDSAVYIDSVSAASISDAVKKIINSENINHDYSRRELCARQLNEKFSWRSVSRLYLNLYVF